MTKNKNNGKAVLAVLAIFADAISAMTDDFALTERRAGKRKQKLRL